MESIWSHSWNTRVLPGLCLRITVLSRFVLQGLGFPKSTPLDCVGAVVNFLQHETGSDLYALCAWLPNSTYNELGVGLRVLDRGARRKTLLPPSNPEASKELLTTALESSVLWAKPGAASGRPANWPLPREAGGAFWHLSPSSSHSFKNRLSQSFLWDISVHLGVQPPSNLNLRAMGR